MKTILFRVTRLLHPITLAVILVGVAGFLLGLIVAVERPDAAVGTPQVNVGEAARIARMETALAGRDSEVAELQAALEKLRVETPPSVAMAEAESRIAGVEAALEVRSAELTALQKELDELSGQLAEAIQSRDDLRKDGEQAARDRDELRRELEQAMQDGDALRKRSAQVGRDRENERTGLEQTIADLRRQLVAAREVASPPEPEVTVREESASPAPAAAKTPPAAVAAPVPEPPAAPAPVAPAPAETEPQMPAPAEPARAEPAEAPQQSAAAPPPPPRGPIAQGIAAYRAADYAKAYSLWLPPALNGSSRAQFFVGALYFEGRGVPADPVLSYMWLRAATKVDDPGAIKLLDRVREGMTGPELAEVETRIANGETIPPR